ncbi:hypothetical protein MYX65_00025 [Acidobacteria bacterium AH-259-L09]|nr:hypothetical protein [Acidobacteria bacterium AH-259-L09]
MSHAILLVYRYMTGIYMLGDLSFLQFVSGFCKGKRCALDHRRVLTVSGNGIGGLEQLICVQWGLDKLEIMAVTPLQMHILRLLMDATPQEVVDLLRWAQQRVADYPCLSELFALPGLVSYWQQQCASWQSPQLKGKVHLYGGSPWDLRGSEIYDVVLLSHAQKVMLDVDGKQLLSLVKPGGLLAVVTPVIFHPNGLRGRMPMRFTDLPVVESAKQKLREDTLPLAYDVGDDQPSHIRWSLEPADTVHVVSFSIASPMRSVLVGELLIQALDTPLPDTVRLATLESAISQVEPSAGAGTESLLILLAEKGA